MSAGSLEAVAEALRQANRIVICGHVSPDGDCVGSQLALAHALRTMGKKAVCLLAKDEPLDATLIDLPGAAEMVPAAGYTGDFDLLCTVDVPTAERLGDAAALLDRAERRVTVDHHLPAGEPLSPVSFIDSEAPACAMLIWKLIGLLGVVCAPEMAQCCYFGLMTDTGGFRYQNTSAAALACAAELVGAGADPAAAARCAFQNRSVASLRLEQTVLGNMEFFADGRGVLSWVTLDDFTSAGAVKADAEPLIDTLRGIRGISVACMLRESTDGVRGSLRAKDDTDVAAVARAFGGGGHKAAAGFTYDGTLEQAVCDVRARLAELL